MRIRVATPCYGCKSRQEGCHGTCPAYKAWSQRHEAEKLRRLEASAERDQWMQMQTQRKIRRQRRERS